MKALKISLVAAVALIIAVLVYPVLGTRCPADRTRAFLFALTSASNAYLTEYGTPPPVDPAKFMAVMGGKTVDGFNPRKIVFFEMEPKNFNAAGELIDARGAPFVWEIDSPEGKLAIWSRGEKQKLTRKKAMEKEYFQVLIE